MSNISNIDDTSAETFLLKRISQRDSDALSKLYDLHSKYLFTIIFYILKDRAESEDVLQEVFLQVWEKIDSYDEALGNPLSWITRITRNKAIDRLRSKGFKKRSGEVELEKVFDFFSNSYSSNPEKNISLSQEQKEVSEALKTLDQKQKDLIELAYFKGFSQSELAEYFNMPLGTVKTRMRTAMISLREKLKHLL